MSLIAPGVPVFGAYPAPPGEKNKTARPALRRAGVASFGKAPPAPQASTSPGDGSRIWQWLKEKSGILLIFALLGAGVGDTVYLARQRESTQERLHNLEAAFGSSFYALELPDGSVQVVSRLPDIPSSVVQSSAPASAFILGQRAEWRYWGSGVFLRDGQGDFYVLTNQHVIDHPTDSGGFTVYPYRQGRGYGATVAASSEPLDLALLKVTDPGFTPPVFIDATRFRDLNRDPLREGELVFLVGNPKQQRHLIMPGLIHARNEDKDGVEYLAACDHGASGGPIFDQQGRLIGIERLVSDPVGHCTGIGIDHIMRWLGEADIPLETRPS